MGKKKSKKKERKPMFDDVSTQAKQAIVAIGLLVLACFFVLSSLGWAGVAGEYTHRFLKFLLGYGFVMAPLLCVMYTIIIFKPREDERISTSKIIGASLLTLAILGLLELTNEGLGGLVGLTVLWPLNSFFGRITSGVVLAALVLISIFLTFNTGIHLPKRRQREEEVLTEEELAQFEEGEEEEEVEEEESEEESEEEEPRKKTMGERLGLAKKETEFVVTSFEGSYEAPALSLLKKSRGKRQAGDVKANSNIIKRTLMEFGINVEMDTVESGPTVTRYSLKPAQGVKISRIVGLRQELQLALKANTIRIEAPIPGKSLVGIEVPNESRSIVGLASLLASPEFTDTSKPLLVALGEDITGKSHFANIARMPHCLIAGTTGSGKSVMIHNLVISLLYRNSPEQLRFIMVDPKRVELTLYDGIPHLLTPVITQAKKAMLSLKWAVKEMERRYDILQSEKMQNLNAYHEKVYKPAKDEWVANGSLEEEKLNLPEPLPYIVIVLDELNDLMQSYPRELEALIVRLAQMSRAVGIHLCLATQRPSVNVITGTIKANIPTRLAFAVASQVDSRTILDQVGAENLIGQGDMLYMTGEMSKPVRLQSGFVSDDELKKVIDYLKNLEDVHNLDNVLDLEGKDGEDANAMFNSMVDDDDEDDELYSDAKQAVIDAGKASTSYLQRKLKVGYSRAARLIDLLEERGVIGPGNGAKPREILVGKEDSEGATDYYGEDDGELNKQPNF